MMFKLDDLEYHYCGNAPYFCGSGTSMPVSKNILEEVGFFRELLGRAHFRILSGDSWAHLFGNCWVGIMSGIFECGSFCKIIWV